MKEKEKFLEKIEEEALGVLKNFKKHPIKTIIMAAILLWVVKKIMKFMRSY